MSSVDNGAEHWRSINLNVKIEWIVEINVFCALRTNFYKTGQKKKNKKKYANVRSERRGWIRWYEENIFDIDKKRKRSGNWTSDKRNFHWNDFVQM